MIGVSLTALIVGGFRSKASLALLGGGGGGGGAVSPARSGGGGGGEGTVSSAIHCGSGRLLSRLIVGIHASGISIPLSLLILLW